jgi:hypothetical protein
VITAFVAAEVDIATVGEVLFALLHACTSSVAPRTLFAACKQAIEEGTDTVERRYLMHILRSSSNSRPGAKLTAKGVLSEFERAPADVSYAYLLFQLMSVLLRAVFMLLRTRAQQ